MVSLKKGEPVTDKPPRPYHRKTKRYNKTGDNSIVPSRAVNDIQPGQYIHGEDFFITNYDKGQRATNSVCRSRSRQYNVWSV